MLSASLHRKTALNVLTYFISAALAASSLLAFANIFQSAQASEPDLTPNLMVGEIKFHQEWNGLGNVITADICNTGDEESATVDYLLSSFEVNNILKTYGRKGFSLPAGKCLSDPDNDYGFSSKEIFAYAADFNLNPQTTDYNVTVKVDTTNALLEITEQDNSKTSLISITPAQLPNLVVEDIYFDPQLKDQTNLLRAKICNRSNFTAKTTQEMKTNFRIIPNEGLAHKYFGFELAANTCTDDNTSPYIKAKDLPGVTQSGSYSITVDADVYPFVIPETNEEGDNSRTKTVYIDLTEPAPQPNLIVKDVQFYQEWNKMGNIVTAKICNIGNEKASADNVHFQFQINGITKRYERLNWYLSPGKCTYTSSNIQPSDIFDGASSFNITKSNYYMVSVKADYFEAIKESNENDNFLAQETYFDLKNWPNLTVQKIEFKQNYNLMKNVLVARVCNKSETTIVDTNTETMKSLFRNNYKSNQNFYSNNFELKAASCTDDKNSPYMAASKLGITKDGTYLINFTVDVSPWVVTEMNENDNHLDQNIYIDLEDVTVPQVPDLVVSQLNFYKKYTNPKLPEQTYQNMIVAKLCNKSDFPLKDDGITTQFTGVSKYDTQATIYISQFSGPIDLMPGKCDDAYISASQIAKKTGYHIVSAEADIYNELKETNESNNYLKKEIYVDFSNQPGLPDLTVKDLQFHDEYFGQPDVVTAEVCNIGDIALKNATFDTHFWINYSDGRARTANHTMLNMTMNPGDCKIANVPASKLADKSGTYEVGAFTDSNGQIDEVTELNNSFTENLYLNFDNVSKPDLKINDLYVHNNQEIRATVCNVGLSDIVQNPQQIITRFHNKTNGVKVTHGWDSMTLRAGECTTNQVFATFSSLGIKDSLTYTIQADADYQNNLQESNEDNNQYTENLYITNQTDLPDLYLDKMQFHSNWQGEPDMIVVPVCNQGKKPVSASGFTTQLTIMDGTNKTALDRISTAIQPGKCDAAAFSASNITSGKAGTFTFKAVADSNQEIKESNESNNTLQQALTVYLLEYPIGQPDLYIKNIYYSKYEPENKYYVYAELCNKGDDAAGTIGSQTKFYQNGATYIDTEDVSSILPGVCVNVLGNPASLNITQTGNYTITVTADTNNVVTENNESNNALTKTIYINIDTPTAYPDLTISNLQFHKQYEQQKNVFSADVCNKSDIEVKNATFNATFWINYSSGASADSTSYKFNNVSFQKQQCMKAFANALEILDNNETYTVYANVDDTNTVKESNELNNDTKATLTVDLGLADLYVDDLYFTSNYKGEKNVIVAEYCNRGDVTAKNFIVTVSNDLGRKNYTITEIGPNNECLVQLTKPGDIGITKTGYYNIFTKVDYENQITEPNENNNVRYEQNVYIDLQEEFHAPQDLRVKTYCPSYNPSCNFKTDPIVTELAWTNPNDAVLFAVSVHTGEISTEEFKKNRDPKKYVPITYENIIREFSVGSPGQTQPIMVGIKLQSSNGRTSDWSNIVTYYPPNYQGGSVPIPPAGFEDEVITGYENYQNPFPDTDLSTLEGKAAAELYRRAVIGGYPDGEFKGYREVNRAEIAKFLLLARYGFVEDIKNNGTFPDVLDGQWYVRFVMKAYQLGIIQGYPDGFFGPERTVNTAEFTKMISLTFGLQENLPYTYLDVPADAWFARYAGAVQKYNLFPSRTQYLNPASLLTRNEIAVAIYQYLLNRNATTPIQQTSLTVALLTEQPIASNLVYHADTEYHVMNISFTPSANEDIYLNKLTLEGLGIHNTSDIQEVLLYIGNTVVARQNYTSKTLNFNLGNGMTLAKGISHKMIVQVKLAASGTPSATFALKLVDGSVSATGVASNKPALIVAQSNIKGPEFTLINQ